MLIQDVDTVIVFVTDLERSIEWYSEVLELPLEWQRGDFAMFNAGNIPLALHGGAQPCDVRENHGSLISFAVEDYASVKAKLVSRGCQFVFENQSPDAIFGTFLDPDGNTLQIAQKKRDDG